MEGIYLSEICEVIYSAAIETDTTICRLSETTGISRDAIRSILQYFYEYPFGGIQVSYQGVPANVDIFDLSDEMLDEVIKWGINISNMDKVPVENLDEEEGYVLVSMLNSIKDEELQSAAGCLSKGKKGSMIYTKGINSSTLGVFRLNQYPVIKKALLKRMTINAFYDGSREPLSINPLGVVFHSEENSWYLICQNSDGIKYPYEIEKLTEISLGTGFMPPQEFDMREYLGRYFGMEIEKGEYIEAVFMDEANVIEKAKRRLESKGEFAALPDGSVKFTGHLVGVEDFMRWILGFGSSVELKQPKWLRDEIIRNNNKVLDNYKRIEEYRALMK